jgi:hypothetical protein
VLYYYLFLWPMGIQSKIKPCSQRLNIIGLRISKHKAVGVGFICCPKMILDYRVFVNDIITGRSLLGLALLNNNISLNLTQKCKDLQCNIQISQNEIIMIGSNQGIPLLHLQIASLLYWSYLNAINDCSSQIRDYQFLNFAMCKY